MNNTNKNPPSYESGFFFCNLFIFSLLIFLCSVDGGNQNSLYFQTII
jgi:hypothetical protein